MLGEQVGSAGSCLSLSHRELWSVSGTTKFVPSKGKETGLLCPGIVQSLPLCANNQYFRPGSYSRLGHFSEEGVTARGCQAGTRGLGHYAQILA